MAFIVPKPQPPTNTLAPGPSLRFAAPVHCGKPMVATAAGQNWQADGRPSKSIWRCMGCGSASYTGQRG